MQSIEEEGNLQSRKSYFKKIKRSKGKNVKAEVFGRLYGVKS
jgi:hypothetical protein